MLSCFSCSNAQQSAVPAPADPGGRAAPPMPGAPAGWAGHMPQHQGAFAGIRGGSSSSLSTLSTCSGISSVCSTLAATAWLEGGSDASGPAGQSSSLSGGSPRWGWPQADPPAAASTATAATTDLAVGGAAAALPAAALPAAFWPLGAAAGAAKAAALASLHPAVRAHLEGTLGIAFSGGGFRYAYFLGVGQVMMSLGLVCPRTRVSGASSGALGAVLLKCGFDAADVLRSTLAFARDCRAHGIKGRLGPALRAYLDMHLPPSAATSNDGSTFLVVTQVWPTIKSALHHTFGSKPELIEAVLASCHLPTISDGSFTVTFKRRPHIDGGLLSVLTPPPGASHTVAVCSMPSRQIARLPAYITRPAQSEISISPDSFQRWPHSRRQTQALAVAPPQEDFIMDMYNRGIHDTKCWAESVGFTRGGLRLWPTAQELGRPALPQWHPAPDEALAALAPSLAPMPAAVPAALGALGAPAEAAALGALASA